MQIKCADFTIDLYEDVHYDPLSADNVIKYEHYYTLEDQQYRLLQRGIRVIDEEKQVVRQVCIAASGGDKGIGEHSYVLFDGRLSVCCGDSIFCLAIHDLTLLWQTKADAITCFGVFAYEKDLIVHGELSISRLTKEGAIAWQFSARDIFVSLTSIINFRIEGRTIYVIDWDGIMYEVDAETGHLLREYREQPSADQLRSTASIDIEKNVRGKTESLSKWLRSFLLRLSSFLPNG